MPEPKKKAGRKPTGRTAFISANVHPATKAEIKRRAKAASGSVGQLFDDTFNPAKRKPRKKAAK